MVRFQADADLNQVIVAALLRRSSAVDSRSAANPSLKGLSDLEVLALAAAEMRILVTHDYKTMPRHFAEFVRSRES
jgi:predicted nuclease of predicted toxin-antitoxin system